MLFCCYLTSNLTSKALVGWSDKNRTNMLLNLMLLWITEGWFWGVCFDFFAYVWGFKYLSKDLQELAYGPYVVLSM